MKPYQTPCPKCGCPRANLTFYRKGEAVRRDDAPVDSKYAVPEIETLKGGIKLVHLPVVVNADCFMHHCQVCGYRWESKAKQKS